MAEAKVISFYTGEQVGPATLEAMQWREMKRRWERQAELIRQIDCYVQAYRFAWEHILETLETVVEEV